MKNSILLLSLLIFSFFAYSQKVEISGQIKDAETRENVSFCNVLVLNEKDSVVMGSYTDESGFFYSSLTPGKYKFIFNQIGYITDTTNYYNLSKEIFLDVFKLSRDVNQIEEVTVKASGNLTYLDKDVQIVTEEITKGASNSYDVLARVKGLNYDRYNDKIKVDNDDNIIIIVNGIEKDAGYIKNLDPERLLKVEIIRSPSGKYALAGYSAVINIVLKTDYTGYDINVSNMAMFNFSKTSDDIFSIDFGDISFNYTNKKFNLYGSYFVLYNTFSIFNERKQYFPNSDSIIYSPLPEEDYSLFVGRMRHNFTLGLDYYISPKHIISYETKFSLSPDKWNITDTKYDVGIYSDNSALNFSSLSMLQENTNTFDNSIYYVANFNSRNTLNVSYAFSVFDNIQNNTVQNGLESLIQLTKNSRLFSTLNVEYTNSLSSTLNLNIGYGNTYKDVDNTFISGVDINENTQDFGYSDLRNQLYTYLSYKPSEKIGFKFGAAAENSTFNHLGNKVSFNILLPHVDINYKPIKIMDVSVKYRASSNYPSISQTNPFEIVNDWQMVTIGNPNLHPSKKNTVSTRISFMGGAFAVEPYYSFTDNLIINTIESRDDGMWVSSFQNAGKYKNKGIKGNITIPFGKSLFLQSSADFYNESLNYSGEIKKLSDWSLTSQFIYRNPKHKTIVGILYQNELTKRLNWTGYSHNGNDFWSVLLLQPMMKEYLSVMLIYVIPTEFGVTYNQGSYINTPMYEEYNNVDLQMVKNMIMFRVSYRFTDGKSAKKLNKNIEIEKESSSKSFI